MFKEKMYIAAKHEVYHYRDIPTKNDVYPVYPLVICYSLPWKDPALRTLNSGKPSINEQIHL